jgi:ATP-binding cassette, subfamily C, bacterial LapB
MPDLELPPKRASVAFLSTSGAIGSVQRWLRSAWDEAFDVIDDLIHHPFFHSLRQTAWDDFQVVPILIASILINILELASPLYINIVYTSVLPSGSLSSLIVLTIAVIILILLGAWLKTVRLGLTGGDGARLEHRRRMEVFSHFLQIRLSNYLKVAPANHLERLESINLLKDEFATQSLTTSIDLLFSFLFILVLFLIAGPVAVIALIAILAYVLKALSAARQFESLSKEVDDLKIDRTTHQVKLLDAAEFIKSNGLNRQVLFGNEQIQEKLSKHRFLRNAMNGKNQAFTAFMSQLTYASILTWGAILVIDGRLTFGALSAALLLAGKILGPWQQAMMQWTSYRKLQHAREEFKELMRTPVELYDEVLSFTFTVDPSEPLLLSSEESILANVKPGSVALLRDSHFGEDARKLLMRIIRVEPDNQLLLNGLAISSYSKSSLRSQIAYVDPARDFFTGSLLENITSFQPKRYQRRALFWSFLSRLDATVKALPHGYATPTGCDIPSGLSRDAQQLFHIVTALARSPKILMIDLADCSYGKEFISGMERIFRRTRGNTTVLLAGTGRVLRNISDYEIDIGTLENEVPA